MKTLLIMILSITFIACEKSQDSSQDDRSSIMPNEKSAPTVSLNELGVYDNGAVIFGTACFYDEIRDVHKTIEITIYDTGEMVVYNKEYYNDTCFFADGAPEVGHYYKWNMNFTEFDGIITANVYKSSMTTFDQDEVNNSYCNGTFQNTGGWDVIDYSNCYEDKTGIEITYTLEEISSGVISIDGIEYTVQ